MDFLGLTSITASLHLLLLTTVLTFCIHSAAQWLLSFFSASHACHEGKEKTRRHGARHRQKAFVFFSILNPLLQACHFHRTHSHQYSLLWNKMLIYY